MEAEKKHPGLDAYEKAAKKSKAETNEYQKDTKKKFEEYSDFNGDTDPSFHTKKVLKLVMKELTVNISTIGMIVRTKSS